MSKRDTGITPKEPVLILIMDLFLSLCASLNSILIIRWISTPIPGFYHIVLRWLAFSAFSTLISELLFRTQKMSIEYLTIRSTGILGYMAGLKCVFMFALMFCIGPLTSRFSGLRLRTLSLERSSDAAAG